jgi:hypothetical protein
MVNFKKLKQIITTQGSGNIVTKEFEVSSFIRLHISLKGDAELIQSDEEKVVVECDDNLLDTFEVVNSGGTLYVMSDAKFKTPAYTRCTVKVYYRELQTLHNASNGNVVLTKPIVLQNPLDLKLQANGNTVLEVDVPSVKLINQSNGNVTVNGKCGELDVKNQANGNLDCKNLAAGIVTLKNQANGNVDIQSVEAISIYHMGNGYVRYYGPGLLKDVKQHGTGPVKHMA